MKTGLIVLLIIVGVLLVGLVVLYFLGRKMQKKQEDNDATMRDGAQIMSMLVIEKKRCKMKESGLPDIMIQQTPKLLRNSKVCIVKAKVGPKVWSFMCDDKAYSLIPEKREAKCLVNGLYIIEVKSARGGLEAPTAKKTLRQKLKDKYDKLKKEEAADAKKKGAANTKTSKKK